MKIMYTQMYHAHLQNYVPNIFVPKYFLVLKAVIFGTLLPEHPVRRVNVSNPEKSIHIEGRIDACNIQEGSPY